MVFEYDLNGRPIIDLPGEAPSLQAAFGILDSLKIP
jgi:hypothetical protein